MVCSSKSDNTYVDKLQLILKSKIGIFLLMKNIQRSVPTYVEYIDSIRWEFCPRHHNRHTPSRSPGQPWVVNIHSFCFIAPAAAHGEDDHHVGSHNSSMVYFTNTS